MASVISNNNITGLIAGDGINSGSYGGHAVGILIDTSTYASITGNVCMFVASLCRRGCRCYRCCIGNNAHHCFHCVVIVVGD